MIHNSGAIRNSFNRLTDSTTDVNSSRDGRGRCGFSGPFLNFRPHRSMSHDRVRLLLLLWRKLPRIRFSLIRFTNHGWNGQRIPLVMTGWQLNFALSKSMHRAAITASQITHSVLKIPLLHCRQMFLPWHPN